MIGKLTLLTLATAAGPALAIDNNFDGSEPLLCTLMAAQICDIYGCRQADRYEDLNGVRHLVIDFERDRIKVAQANSRIEAPIGSRKQVDDRLFLSGVNQQAGANADESRGWNIVIANPTGTMTLTVAGDDVAMASFGACTPVID